MAAVPKFEAVGDETPLTALVVDDEAVNRIVLGAMLREQGFIVVEADDGRHACEVCRQAAPDIVFMDIMMPEMDGHEATRAIKSLLLPQFVPVIFLTAISDDHQLRRCIEVGGDDFLVKPYSRTLLRAKIDAALRSRAMHRDLAEQRDALTQYRARQQRDMEVAKRILDNLASQNRLGVPNVRYALRPMETLNGDVIFATNRPTGEQCFLVGDFTGHGLPAAIGAMMAHGIFMSMVAKGFGIEDIVLELNRKMCTLLPVDRFLSAALLELHLDTGLLKVWNGGMPDILVRSAAGRVITRYPSENVPIGIVPPRDYAATARCATLAPGDQLLVYSDGLIEAHGPTAELFGNARLQAVMDTPGPAFERFDALLASLGQHVQTAPQSDDVSVLYVVCDPALAPPAEDDPSHATVTRRPGTWRLELDLGADELKASEPVATVMQVFDTVQGLGALRTPLFLILTELFSNALEHGLLALDSAVKHRPNGFAEYYQQRQERLEGLGEATMSIRCRHAPCGDGGALEIRLAHNGRGFDPSLLPVQLADNGEFKGRGIRLVRSLCAELRYEDDGRMAIATYLWSDAASRAA
ncbi:MAG: SpoIIE family protein phosphatase [Gammaproteobacteria bacterium]